MTAAEDAAADTRPLTSLVTLARLRSQPNTTRINIAPLLTHVRCDHQEGVIFSVETIRLVRFPVPSRPTREEEVEDHSWRRRLWLMKQGYDNNERSTVEHDVKWNEEVNTRDARAVSVLDWTVYAQAYNAKHPHRPYCEGPPAHPLNAKVWWIPLLEDAFTEGDTPSVSALRDGPPLGIIHPQYVLHLQESHAFFSRLAKEQYKGVPNHQLRQLYNPLEEQWAFKLNFGDLQRPMPWKDARVAWLLFQRHVRNLIGLCNFFDAQFLEQYQYGPTHPPWTFNLVSVLHKSVPEGEIRQALLQHGVPILEHYRTPNGRPADRCHTCKWVKAQRQALKQQHPTTCKFNPQQSLEPEARNLSRAAAAARPNKRTRAHTVSQAQGQAPANAEAGSSTLPTNKNRVVRQAVVKKAAITKISPYGGATSKKNELQLRQFDDPAQWR
jgi:hypothetical protein